MDIVRRLRATRADMLGTSDEKHYWDCHEAAGRIEEDAEIYGLLLRCIEYLNHLRDTTPHQNIKDEIDELLGESD